MKGFLQELATHEGRPTPVARRVSPISAIRAQIDELFSSGRDLGTVLEEVGRLTVRLMMQ